VVSVFDRSDESWAFDVHLHGVTDDLVRSALGIPPQIVAGFEVEERHLDVIHRHSRMTIDLDRYEAVIELLRLV